MPEYVTIDGIDDVKADLLGLPEAIVRDMFPDALRAGGDVLERELISRTPQSEKETTSEKEYGSLRNDIGTETKVSQEYLDGNVKVGFGAKGYVARFIEFGHREVTHKGEDVGEVAANPFMRQSADTAADAAVDAFAESLGDQIK